MAAQKRTNEAVAKLMGLADLTFEEAVSAMYAYEMELPKISRQDRWTEKVARYGQRGRNKIL